MDTTLRLAPSSGAPRDELSVDEVNRLARLWLQESLAHLDGCNDENCEWWHAMSAFMSRHRVRRFRAATPTKNPPPKVKCAGCGQEYFDGDADGDYMGEGVYARECSLNSRPYGKLCRECWAQKLRNLLK